MSVVVTELCLCTVSLLQTLPDIIICRTDFSTFCSSGSWSFVFRFSCVLYMSSSLRQFFMKGANKGTTTAGNILSWWIIVTWDVTVVTRYKHTCKSCVKHMCFVLQRSHECEINIAMRKWNGFYLDLQYRSLSTWVVCLGKGNSESKMFSF